MKIKNVMFCGFLLLNSCASEQKEYQKYIEIINGINDKVAFDNRCKLTSTYTDQEPDRIDLKIGNSYTDLFLPGKILIEYHGRVSKSKLNLREYNLGDLNNEKLYSLTNTDFSMIEQKVNVSKSLLVGFESKDLTKLYNALDTMVTNQISLEDFSQQMLNIDLRGAGFSGFQLVDSVLGIGYKNSTNQIVFIYKWNSKDHVLYGVNIE